LGPIPNPQSPIPKTPNPKKKLNFQNLIIIINK